MISDTTKRAILVEAQCFENASVAKPSPQGMVDYLAKHLFGHLAGVFPDQDPAQVALVGAIAALMPQDMKQRLGMVDSRGPEGSGPPAKAEPWPESARPIESALLGGIDKLLDKAAASGRLGQPLWPVWFAVAFAAGWFRDGIFGSRAWDRPWPMARAVLEEWAFSIARSIWQCYFGIPNDRLLKEFAQDMIGDFLCKPKGREKAAYKAFQRLCYWKPRKGTGLRGFLRHAIGGFPGKPARILANKFTSGLLYPLARDAGILWVTDMAFKRCTICRTESPYHDHPCQLHDGHDILIFGEPRILQPQAWKYNFVDVRFCHHHKVPVTRLDCPVCHKRRAPNWLCRCAEPDNVRDWIRERRCSSCRAARPAKPHRAFIWFCGCKKSGHARRQLYPPTSRCPDCGQSRPSFWTCHGHGHVVDGLDLRSCPHCGHELSTQVASLAVWAGPVRRGQQADLDDSDDALAQLPDASSDSSPHETVSRADEIDALYKAIDNLPPLLAKIMRMQLDSQSVKAIARKLGLAERSVRQYRQEAIQRLGRDLGH
jgi:hypothetical protein